MIEVKDIQLTKKAMKLLKTISDAKNYEVSSISDSDAFKLLLEYELVSFSRNGQWVYIVPKGTQVLLRYENEKRARSQEHRHNWRIAIFSTLGGAILSKPIWDIIDWFIQLFF